jgi:hypothetical protein
MVMKQRITVGKAKARGRDPVGHIKPDEDALVIKAAVWGQLEPLQRVANEKIKRWGDYLPKCVPPEMAGRFEAAYEALEAAVLDNNVVKTHEIAGQLMRAWDVLEKTAIAAGHEPLKESAWCVQMEEGDVICIALHGHAELRQKFPHWTVYGIEDACRILRADWTAAFLDKAYDSFPNAKLTKVVYNGEDKEPINWDLGGDDIPW